MVQITEPKDEWLEFKGKVISVEKEYSEDFDIERYHIQIEPIDKEWKNQHIWIPISRYSTEERIIKGTALAEFIKKLNEMRITGKTANETFKKMIGKEFVFHKKIIGQFKKEIWVPKSLIEYKEKNTKKIKLIRNPLKG